MLQTPPSTTISLRAFLRFLRESEEEVAVLGGITTRNPWNLMRELEDEITFGKRHELDTVRVDWRPVFSLPEEGRWPPQDREKNSASG